MKSSFEKKRKQIYKYGEDPKKRKEKEESK